MGFKCFSVCKHIHSSFYLRQQKLTMSRSSSIPFPPLCFTINQSIDQSITQHRHSSFYLRQQKLTMSRSSSIPFPPLCFTINQSINQLINQLINTDTLLLSQATETHNVKKLIYTVSSPVFHNQSINQSIDQSINQHRHSSFISGNRNSQCQEARLYRFLPCVSQSTPDLPQDTCITLLMDLT